jgi:propanol-preferring alcohol dehydrogenase
MGFGPIKCGENAKPGSAVRNVHYTRRTSKMRAMVLHSLGGPLELEDVPVPEVGPGEALAKVHACGVGYTVSKTRARGIAPRIPGHEVAGEIIEIGDGVKHLRVGDPVTVYYYLTCGICKFCRGGKETLCLNSGGNVGVHVNGGYAEYIKLPAENFIRLPKEIPPVEASIIADAISTPWKVMKMKANLKPLDEILIVGAGGGVGIHAVSIAKLFGARVIAADISEEKLDGAEKCGADELINTRRASLDQEVKRLTGNKGVEAAVDFVNITETLEACLKSLAPGGKLICMTGGTFQVNTQMLVDKELEIMGSRYVTKQELTESIELVKQGRIKLIVSRTFPLEQAELAHKLVDEHKVVGRAVLEI